MKRCIYFFLTIVLLFGMMQTSITAFAGEPPVSYTIVFNSNGGTGTMKSVSVKYDTKKKLPANTFKKTGYSFKNWNTKKDGSGKAYSNSASVKNIATKKTNKVTLYAQWSLKKGYYKITYKLNGGKNNSKNPAAYTKSQTVKLQNPTKTGYVFKGWYSDSKLTKKVTTIKQGSKGSKTFYAKWAVAKYTIAFNANGGKGTTKSVPATYNKTVKLTSNGFKRTGYSFNGWNTKKDGSGKKYANKASVKNLTSTNGKTVTLYAQWKQNITDQKELAEAINILRRTCEPARKWHNREYVSYCTRNVNGEDCMLWSCSTKNAILNCITAYSGTSPNKVLAYSYSDHSSPILSLLNSNGELWSGFSSQIYNGTYDFAKDPGKIKIKWRAYDDKTTKAEMEAMMNQKISDDVYKAVCSKYSFYTDFSRGNNVIIIYGKNAKGILVAKYAGYLMNYASDSTTYNFVCVNPANKDQYGKSMSGSIYYKE